MQYEFNLYFSSILQILEQKGFDIRCNNIPSAQLIQELYDLCKEYLIDVEQTNLLYFVFDLYVRCQSKQLKAIDLSFGNHQYFKISLPIFWEIISCNDLDVTKLSEVVKNYDEDILLRRLENFIVDYCKYLILRETNRHYTQLYLIITKIKEVPQHSILCTNFFPRHPILIRTIFLKICTFLIEYLENKNEPDSFKLSQPDSQYDLRREIVLVCLSHLQYNYDKSDLPLDELLIYQCNKNSLSPSISAIADIYRSLNEGLNIKEVNSNGDEEFLTVFSDDNQLILTLLQLCVKYNLHKHISEDFFLIHNDFNSVIINAYHLARSVKILNTMLSITLDSSNLDEKPVLRQELTQENIWKVIRSLLKVITNILKKQFEIVFTEELLHINFLTWCLESKLYVKSIFLWYIDSKLYNFEVEEKFLFYFNDLVSYICEPFLCIKLVIRMCLVYEGNLPLNRYIKLLKLFIFEMKNEMKQTVLLELRKLQLSRSICSSVSFEAYLRKCCNQLSCDSDNETEVCLDLEYLLLINPVIVICELMKIQCFKSGLTHSIKQIFTKISYSFNILLEDDEMIIIKTIRNVLFEGNTVDNKALDFKKISDQIFFCVDDMFKLIEENSIAGTVFSNLISPHFDVGDTYFSSAYILLSIVLSNPKLHNLNFSSKLSATLIKLADSHRYLYNGNGCDSVNICVIESCIHTILTKLYEDLDYCFIENFINSMDMSHTKFLFWPLFIQRNIHMTISFNIYKFLSLNILLKYSIVPAVKSKSESSTEMSIDADIINDFGAILLLCSTSQELLEVVQESTILMYDFGRLKISHVITVLLEISQTCSSACWKRVLNYIMFCVNKSFIIWFYRPMSLHCPLEDNKNYKDVLMILSLIHSVLNLTVLKPENVWLPKLLVTSLSEIIPQSLSEDKSYSAELFFVQLEILLHYLRIYKTLESRGKFGLKSVLLVAIPILHCMSLYNDDIPISMKDLLEDLVDYERLIK